MRQAVIFFQRDLLRYLLICIVLLLPAGFCAAEEKLKLSEEQTKALLIFNFIKFIQWPNEKSIPTFLVGSFYPQLDSELEKIFTVSTVRGKRIKLVHINNVDEARKLHVLILPKSYNSRLEELASELLKSQTLIVSDQSENKRVIMINFTAQKKNRISFEVNKNNIEFEGLETSPELLLHGGSKVDVALLYKEMELLVKNMKKQVQQYHDELAEFQQEAKRQAAELEQRKKEVDKANEELLDKNRALRERVEHLRFFEGELARTKEELLRNRQELDTKEKQLSQKEQEMASLAHQIDGNNDVLEKQKKEIAGYIELIKQHQSVLREHVSVISSQKNTLYFSLVSFVLIIVFLIILVVSNRRKQELLTERKVRQATESSLELKNEFITSISHELRTPMHAIFGGLEVLKSLDKDNELQEQAAIIEMGAEEMMHLINDVLTYTEIQSGKLTLNIEDVNLGNALSSLEEHYQKLCDQKDLSLQWSVAQDLPQWLSLDGDKTLAIVTKLLDNAVKFTRSGLIELRVTVAEPSAEQTQLEIVIKDTGIGLDSADKETVFNAFRKTGSTSQRRYSGLGIGLSICREFVELMGGELMMETSGNQGTRFLVTLPVTKGRDPAEHELLKAGAAKRNAPILVVEDNLVNQKVMSRMLEKLGYETLLAEQGTQALKILQQRDVSLVLMDLQMPVMDGYTCAQKIRDSASSFQHVPIIAVTANVMEEDKRRCFDVGMNEYLRKPVKMEMLKNAVQKYLKSPEQPVHQGA